MTKLVSVQPLCATWSNDVQACAFNVPVSENNDNNFHMSYNFLNFARNSTARLLNSVGSIAADWSGTHECRSCQLSDKSVRIWNSATMDELVEKADNIENEDKHSEFKVSPVDDGREIVNGMNAFERFIKRAFDCSFAGITLLLFSPLFLVCFILVRREDGGKAIYSQERIGKGGRPFYIYKFRSMRLDAEKFGPQLFNASGEDPRLTKIGKFIRAHHLDELPQLWNVFVGDMSFIGPRPERQFYIDKIMAVDSRYKYLYQIRPGVTSFATLYNGYTDTLEKMVSRLHYDLYYLQHGSLSQDLSLLWKTFYSIVGGKKF